MTDSNLDPKLANAEAKAAKAKAKALRPWFKKKRIIVPIALVAIIGISTAANGGPKSANTGSETNNAQTDTAEEPSTSETVAQANARDKAQSYLDISAFSREGLIKQLVFEKFDKADAEYGVDALKVDWNEEAARKAQDYLDIQSFSKGGLIDQLKFEGFTKAQAEYGADKAGL